MALFKIDDEDDEHQPELFRSPAERSHLIATARSKGLSFIDALAIIGSTP
jgi:hypothetical protein